MSFINAKIFDGTRSDYLDESVVVVENDCIVAVERKLDAASAGDVIDVRGNTLMPGLIDAHCHVLGSSLRVTDTETQPLTYVASYASKMLGHALDCGFTTLRDVGGGDMGIARAVEDRLIKGPRVFFAGRVLSMTGGHGDFRDPFSSIGACACSADGRVAVIVDGVDAVRAAAREELRRGAHCIKIMLSGGVLSPTDPIWMDQFSDEEVSAAVEEAARRRKYVAAHCHPPSSIGRAARLGVRTIEHATLIDETCGGRQSGRCLRGADHGHRACIARGRKVGLVAGMGGHQAQGSERQLAAGPGNHGSPGPQNRLWHRSIGASAYPPSP
jgi:imidazolonepropionase-like amidohydrolase